MNEYQRREYEKKLRLVKLLNSFDSGYRFELVKNKEELSASLIKLNSDIPVCVNFIDYEGKYSFYLDYSLPYITYATEKQIREKLGKEPKRVGVLNKNKIANWVKYLSEVYQELIKTSGEREKKVNSFLEEFEKTDGEKQVMMTNEYRKTYSGSIIKNGVVLEFSIDEEGYICQRIEISYSVEDNLSNFVALSDNKYQG
jgi:predicted phosphoadenosine phosphosulfate sulfurtransferase